jgi:hypothetical protein
MIYVYAVTNQPQQELPRQPGLRGQGLSKIICRDLAAIVSSYDGPAPSPSVDDVWCHEAVIESLMSDSALVPMRFGTLVPSRRHLKVILCRTYPALAKDIERVRGRVEIGLRFLSMIDEDTEGDSRPARNAVELPGTGNGSAYLRRLMMKERRGLARRRSMHGQVRDVYDQLAGHACGGRFDDEAKDLRGYAAAFLVQRDAIAAFRDIVRSAAEANPGIALLCTGPWPPYSFVGDDLIGPKRNEPLHAN